MADLSDGSSVRVVVHVRGGFDGERVEGMGSEDG